MRKRAIEAQSLWLMLVILAIWEAEVRKIMVLDQARQTVHKTPFQPIACACHPKLHGKLRLGRVVVPGQPRQKKWS
jgi:hypothetical protein